MTFSTPPYLSLGVMCGDEHAGKPLERCLRSVLEMKAGCPVDEVVVGFNGTKEGTPALVGALQRLGYRRGADHAPDGAGVAVWDWEAPSTFPRPPLKVVTFPWPGRFDTARNTYWKYLTGEWLFSIDADDVLADAGTPEGLAAIEAVERDYGIAPPPPNAPSLTIKQWLRGLPAHFNFVYTAYDYTIDPATDYVHVRQKVKRLVRRSVGHVWYCPDQSGVHEYLHPLGAVPEVPAENLGLLLRHLPSQSDIDRAKRNADILGALTTSELPIDSRHAYDVTNAQLMQGNLDKADAAIKVAIQQAKNEMDAYVYRLCRSTLMFQKGNPEAALQEALSAMALLPDMQDAYFVAVDAWYRMGRWGAAVEWYERGLAKKPTLLTLDQPLGKFIHPRQQAAWAYLMTGKPHEALKLAQECVSRYPKDPTAAEIYDRAAKAVVMERLHTSLLDAAELLLDEAPMLSDLIMRVIPQYCVTRGVETGLRGRALAARLNGMRSMLDSPTPPLPEDGVFSRHGARIDVVDALRFAGDEHQLLSFQQLDKRSAKVSSRRAATPSVAFYSPAAVEMWKASDLHDRGLGGSEGSFVYLARELAKRGHVVEFFTPRNARDGAQALWSGEHKGQKFSIIEKDISMGIAATSDVIVACRSPHLAREFAEPWADKQVYCWHQDNGYGNPWMWAPDVAAMQSHLHVSQWAMKGLLREAYGENTVPPGQHFVLGNGVGLECLDDWEKFERKPNRVIYASDPSRGLEALLTAWPEVRERVPDAELLIYSRYTVMQALNQEAPGLPVMKRIQAMADAVDALGDHGVKMMGWRPQEEVLSVMKSSSVYCYPGGPMPEGFGVSLAQAAACGCIVLAPLEGALPEVLGRVQQLLVRENLVADLVESLRAGRSAETRRRDAEGIVGQHGWPMVADRFLSIVKGQS